MIYYKMMGKTDILSRYLHGGPVSTN